MRYISIVLLCASMTTIVVASQKSQSKFSISRSSSTPAKSHESVSQAIAATRPTPSFTTRSKETHDLARSLVICSLTPRTSAGQEQSEQCMETATATYLELAPEQKGKVSDDISPGGTIINGIQYHYSAGKWVPQDTRRRRP